MQDLVPIQYSILIPLLPLIGAAVAGFFGAKWLRGQSHWPIWLGVGASAVLSIWLLVGMVGLSGHHDTPEARHAAAADEVASSQFPLAYNINWFTWIAAGDPADAGTAKYLYVPFGFFFDPLTAVMLCVVCGIGFFITVFAAGYMKGEEGYFRFFAYLGLFIFAMTCLVMGNNLVLLYLGWEGVGLCSYLLIGYYYDKPAAREAAKKAFLVNRVGDFGFGLGIMLSFLAFGTVSFFGTQAGGDVDGILEMATRAGTGGLTPFQQTALDWIPFLLMVGAFGKSAQFPLYVWLPDAMEGPTPVSALIHAATMVTAGVYMIARCSALFVTNEAALWTIAIVGAFTAIFAASIALRQFDLKKVFAYSTISQLGFMFVGVAVLAPVAGVFHLVTHAFFKALLFLGSGVVMHAMAGELDMRRMSGLKRVLPVTRWLMLIGCLALAGFPLLSGFFSKDEIVAGALAWHPLLGIVLLITAFMTAYYTFRLYYRVFEGPEVVPAAPPHGHEPVNHAHASASAIQTGTAGESGVDEHLQHDPHHGGAVHGHDHHHNHEPAIMILPLVVLAVGAIFAGYLNFPQHWLGHFLGESPSLHIGYNLATGLNVAEFSENVNPLPFGQVDNRPKESQEREHQLHLWLMIVSGAVSVAGIFVARLLHLKYREQADELADRYRGIAAMLEAKYWVDEIYQAAIVEPLRKLGRVFFLIDSWIVDGVVNTIGFVPQLSGFALKFSTQRGYLQGYAATMLFGIAVILVILFW